MDEHLKQQIEDILKHLDEQPIPTTEDDPVNQGHIVHVYLMNNGNNQGGKTPGNRCTTALFPQPRRVFHLIGLCILVACVGFIFSLFPIITTTTTTIASTAATITTQQSTLGPTGVALMIGGLALLTGFLVLERKQN